ncbi:MAG: hypothetical protein HZB15_16295, partial [Actinobacteria bacterium]|nr:hypothetical protein [Actinomycetota bacterium]
MTSPDSRAFRALQHLDGQFSLLMDEQFEIIWHSTSVERVLGWTDVTGRSAIEF